MLKFVLLKMLSIVLIGTGNIAQHLFAIFNQKKGLVIEQVFGRNPDMLSKFAATCKTTVDPNNIMAADIYIIAVSDNAIGEVSKVLEDKKGLVVHTSGGSSIDIIIPKRKGVFYPLQTFTKNKVVDFSTIPICIETNNKEDLPLLQNLAQKLSSVVHEVSSEQREKLHLTAVFANNFTNHMYTIASSLCEKENLPFDILKPLIHETSEKLRFLSPNDAQTGPAIRNDVVTMQKHIENLENPIHKKIYQLISESIKEKNEEKL